MTAFRMKPGLLGQVAISADVARVMQEKGRRVLARAQATAPVRTGDYARSLHLVTGVEGGRAKARVGSTDPAARIIEAKHHTLANALEAARG